MRTRHTRKLETWDPRNTKRGEAKKPEKGKPGNPTGADSEDGKGALPTRQIREPKETKGPRG